MQPPIYKEEFNVAQGNMMISLILAQFLQPK